MAAYIKHRISLISLSRKLIALAVLTSLVSANGLAQELFPIAEPASSIPVKTLGVRAYSEFYKEFAELRNVNTIRLMYGVTPKLSVYGTLSMSNHHKEKLPTEYPYHNTPERGVKKPYKFNGLSLYAKYRFYSHDRQNEHLRLAAYAEGSFVNTAHDEGEPRLMDDTKGFGGGLIGTYLKNKFAVSLSVGAIFPGKFTGVQIDLMPSLPDIPTVVKYGNALQYSLSLGYLVLPRTYEDYKQLNVNVYLEFFGKYYDDVRVWLTPTNAPQYEVRTSYFPEALKAGFYVDAIPGLQFIINSNTRIDLSANFKLINQSYAHLYPRFNVGIQHYFYFK